MMNHKISNDMKERALYLPLEARLQTLWVCRREVLGNGKGIMLYVHEAFQINQGTSEAADRRYV